MRLFYEVELTNIQCKKEWGIDATVSNLTAYWNDRSEEYHQQMGHGGQSVDPIKQMKCRNAWRIFHLAQFLELSPGEIQDLSLTDAEMLLQWLDNFPADQHGRYGLRRTKIPFEKRY